MKRATCHIPGKLLAVLWESKKGRSWLPNVSQAPSGHTWTNMATVRCGLCQEEDWGEKRHPALFCTSMGLRTYLSWQGPCLVFVPPWHHISRVWWHVSLTLALRHEGRKSRSSSPSLAPWQVWDQPDVQKTLSKQILNKRFLAFLRSSFCYGEPTRDGLSDDVYSQMKVFIPASWDHTLVFRDLGVALNVHKDLEGRNHILVSHAAA